MAVPARPLECKDVTVPKLRISGKRARLRVINTGLVNQERPLFVLERIQVINFPPQRALTGFTLSMSGHVMTLLKVDGGNAVASAPLTQSIGILYPGERIDAVVQRFDIEEQKDAQLTIRLDREYSRPHLL